MNRSAPAPTIDGTLALRPERVPEGSTLHARIVDAEGRTLSEDTVQGTGRRAALALPLEPAAAAHADQSNVPLTLELQLDQGPVARQALVML